jgi:hypothetical protein
LAAHRNGNTRFTDVLVDLSTGNHLDIRVDAGSVERLMPLWVDRLEQGVRVAVERLGGELRWPAGVGSDQIYGAPREFVSFAASLAQAVDAFRPRLGELARVAEQLLLPLDGRGSLVATDGAILTVEDYSTTIDVNITDPNNAGWPALASFLARRDGDNDLHIFGGLYRLRVGENHWRDETGIVNEARALRDRAQELADRVSLHLDAIGR